ncbi:hypothetical protein AAFF_G00438170 [Aldrovandia affinis]|uniref:PurE domain-containing protein n=1 Tax=Aldrovandia affinis TaxID=143900 RepID=A0AAD7WHS9_9TELE|nr:hypothetical protein AAFF_G00438170 [Aldrovandia affinis]
MEAEAGRPWTEEEVRSLLAVWTDQNVEQGLRGGWGQDRAVFTSVSSRLQVLGVARSWRQCCAKYRSLRQQPSTANSQTMAFYQDPATILAPEEGAGLSREAGRANQEERCRIKPTFGPGTRVELEVGKHWADEEVRALLHTWAERREELRGAARNKSIFQEMSRRLQRLGVDRSWKQCRTKYKNLKYDYKSAKSTPGPDGPPKSMKFYCEVEALVLGIDPQGLWRGPERDQPTPNNKGERGPLDMRSGAGGADVGRNWQEEEVRALVSIWAEEPVKRQLENATRNRDIFLHISQRLRQLGVERDWKQCRTKYKNLKYVYRSLQRAPPDPALPGHAHPGHAHPGHAMSFYREVDAILRKASIEQAPATQLHRTGHRSTPVAYTASDKEHRLSAEMASAPELKIGKKLNEGKTKEIYELPDQQFHVLVQSKDQITAGNAVRKDQMEGKAAIANKTTSCVFRLLQDSGIKTAFVKQQSDTAFVAAQCEMIPIEWVCRRVATGSFLKRNPGVNEGYRFSPLKIELFFKDDANNDPQWSEEQLLEAKFCFSGLDIGRCEVDIMNRSTVAIFEILERAWATQNCTLVDMKIEFGVNVETKEVILADVIDNDSWRLWPAGDRSQQKDKQVYRDLKEVTPEAMQMVKRNFEWVSERVELLLEPQSRGRVVVLMGSVSDLPHCERIRSACTTYGLPCTLRVTSAHKGPDETLRIKAQYEGDGVPTVFVAVAGRSNGLGPVMSGNTAYPVINCPPLTPNWGAQDVWSSLRMPSGLGCSTVLSPDAAGQFAAQVLGLSDHLVWAKLRASMLNTWVSLKQADKKLQGCSL